MGLAIEGNTALVTASSSGLGKASAAVLAREGANVVINGRDEDRLEAAASTILSEAEGNVEPIVADITDPAAIGALVEATVDTFGGIDHLVTSAGGPPGRRFFETTDEEWYDAFELLVMSVVRLVREAGPHLRADGGGTVVNITSCVAKEANPSNVLSSAVRMSVLGLEKSLASELAPDVRVNALLPHLHDTPRIQELVSQGLDLQSRRADLPMGRIGRPEELGEVVAFLCSPRSSFVNGVALPHDGGAMQSTL
ncbi:MAG: SDR family oxidoreductase [Halobacteriota archaeon]